MSQNQEIYSNGLSDETQTNGHSFGATSDTFLFSSESVGEGHPGNNLFISESLFYYLREYSLRFFRKFF